MTKQIGIADEEAFKTLAVLQLLLQDYHPRDFTVCLWDGSQWPAETTSPHFTLVLKHSDALRSMLRNTATDLSISEAYICGKLDIKGDLEAAMAIVAIALPRNSG
jgi:SCP-2 sterol transfer family